MSEPSAWQCCFCGETIEHERPRVVLLPLDDGGEQQLQAHEECLRRALHPSVPLAL